MKIPLHFLTSTLSVHSLAVSVYSDPSFNEIVAFLHEEGKEGSYYVKMRIALKKGGMVQEIYEKKLIQREIFRPPDSHEISSEITHRIRHFARRHGASSDRIYFHTLGHEGEKKTPTLDLPPLWLDPKVTPIIQEIYDRKREEEKMAHALKLCEEGERLFRGKRYRAALRHFRDASQIAPNFYWPFLGIGEVLIQEGKWENARTHLEQAKKLFERTSRISRDKRKKIHWRVEEAFSRLRSRHEETQVSQPPTAPSSAVGLEEPLRTPSDIPSSVAVSFTVEPLASSLRECYRDGKFEGLDLYTLRLEAERLKFLEGFDELLAPRHARIESYEHQIHTARIVLRRMRGRALLADEVGLGKTIEAGLVLKEYLMRGMVSRVLILAVPSLVSQWRDEMFEKFDLSFATTEEIHQFNPSTLFWTSHPRVIASLSLAKREPHQNAILNQEYDLVIVDEAHHLRNRETAAWKFVSQLKKKFLLLLTATPLQNDLEELYNLVTLLRPGQLGTPSQFRGQFVEKGNVRKPKNTEALRTLLREVMIRNTRVSAKVPLPRRIARTLSIEASEEEQRLYHLVSEWIRDVHRGKGVSRMILSLLQRQAGSSFQAVSVTLQKFESEVASNFRDRLSEIKETFPCLKESSKLLALERVLSHTKDKCLIFTEFLGTQSHLAEFLREKGCDPLLFHGALSGSEKAEVIRRFQEKGRILISTPSGGEGTNLQFCRTIINYDLPWNPMKIEQRIGRIHRIGQTGETLIYNFAAQGTVEHYLLKILDEKLNLFELVVGEAETILGELTEEKNFEEILMDIWLEARNPEELELRIDHFGDRILQEKEKYLEIKKFDEKLLGTDYETV